MGRQRPPGRRASSVQALPAACSPSWPRGVFAAPSPSLHVVLCSYLIRLTRVRTPSGGLSRAPAPSVPFRPLVSEPLGLGDGRAVPAPDRGRRLLSQPCLGLTPLQVPSHPVPKGVQADPPEAPPTTGCASKVGAGVGAPGLLC